MSTFVHLQLSMVLLSSDSFPPFIIQNFLVALLTLPSFHFTLLYFTTTLLFILFFFYSQRCFRHGLPLPKFTVPHVLEWLALEQSLVIGNIRKKRADTVGKYLEKRIIFSRWILVSTLMRMDLFYQVIDVLLLLDSYLCYGLFDHLLTDSLSLTHILNNPLSHPLPRTLTLSLSPSYLLTPSFSHLLSFPLILVLFNIFHTLPLPLSHLLSFHTLNSKQFKSS